MIFLSLFLTSLVTVCADFLPGVAQEYRLHDPLTSTKTQIPYDYYSLPYCRPDVLTLEKENLGEVISGDRIENSVYTIEALKQESCQIACKKTLTAAERDLFIRSIDESYRVHWIVDGLPVATYDNDEVQGTSFVRGFPVGFSVGTGKKPKHYLNNHIRIILQYHAGESASEEEGGRAVKIVGFRVEPMSIKHSFSDSQETVLSTCPSASSASALFAPPSPSLAQALWLDKAESVVFSYDVSWEASETKWTQRWDAYVRASGAGLDSVHWFGITNSFMVVLFLAVMVAVILIRALRKDIAHYNDPKALEEAKEESGWKLVHGDVFRPPPHALLLSVFVGSGLHLLVLSFALPAFSLLGLLSPQHSGALTHALLMLYPLLGCLAGYCAAATFKLMRGADWRANAALAALLYPGTVSVVVLILNLALAATGSSGAMPFSTLLSLLFLWICVSVPLVLIGSFFGFKAESLTFPTRTHVIPRAVPTQPWLLHPALCCLLGGALPFAAVAVELHFVMSALWLHQMHVIFGFILLALAVLVLTCALVAIIICYFQLCNEDYRWWWLSFLSPGSCALYVLLYAAWYQLSELGVEGVLPLLLYSGYMALGALTAFLVTGAVGFVACLHFNMQIYGSIKVD